jgi:hypothetical protein
VSDDPLLDRKVEDVASGLVPYYSNMLGNVALSNKENALTIISYIHVMRTEAIFSNYFQNKLSFKEITRNGLLEFLDSFRKPESVDTLHKWIGTYNIHRIHLTRFFKWLYWPDVEPNKRPKPPVVDNIVHLKRKEPSIYKPSDLWTNKIFILYSHNFICTLRDSSNNSTTTIQI